MNFFSSIFILTEKSNLKKKFIAAAIASFGAVSKSEKAEKLPTELKTKFEEVGEEQALILHDNLEVVERLEFFITVDNTLQDCHNFPTKTLLSLRQ